MESCPVEYAIGVLSGKWKMMILWNMSREKRIRFNELQRRVKGISTVMLSKSLKELESDGLIARFQYNEVPPRVEYDLTDLGREAWELLAGLAPWAEKVFRVKEAHSA